MFNAMDIQVRLVHDMNIDQWYGVTVYAPAAPDVVFIFLNADQQAEQQKKTMRHELFHVLNGDYLHKVADVEAVEAEARRHENDTALDAVIAEMKLWEQAVHIDRSGAPYRLPTDEGIEVSTAAAGSCQERPQQARTCRIDDRMTATI